MTTRTPAAQSTSTRPAAPRPSATEAPAGSIPGHLRRRTVVTAGVLGLCAGMPEIAAAAGPVGAGSPAPSAGPAPSPFASPSAEDATVPALIPLPVSVEAQAGEPFELTETTRIAAGGEAADAAAVLSEELRTATGLPLPVVEDTAAAGTIRLHVHEGGAPTGHEQEGYRLAVNAELVDLEASTREGALLGIRTLQQLFGAWSTSSRAEAAPRLRAPAVTISDHPRFSYRGFGLDVTRSFYDVDEVETVIDRASRVKLNVLHLHLSDDQGWRIVIDGTADATSGIDYSRLTSISGATAMTRNDQGELMGTELGRTGCYTKDDYRRIVEYAASRGITVVPEIDVPGHTNAALHAIPQLNSAGSLPRPAGGQETPPANGTPNVGYSSLDVANPASYDFVRTVMGELAELTPGPFLHMGGDESHSTPEGDYHEMVTRFASTVADTGKRVMGWNEYASGDLPAGAVVQYWNENAQAVATNVLRNDASVVLSPAWRTYVPQKADAAQERGATWACGGPCTIVDWYDWDPARELPGVEEPRVLGVEAVHWGEWIRGIEQMDDYVWPRALATAEVGWSPQSARVTDEFLGRAEQLMPSLQLAGVNPHPIPELEAVEVISARRRQDGARVSLEVRASAASADPSAVTARSVGASGRTREITLSSEADLSVPMVESSAVNGNLGGVDPRRPTQRVELLVDGQVVAEALDIP